MKLIHQKLILIFFLLVSPPAQASKEKAAALVDDIPKILWLAMHEWGALEKTPNFDETFEYFMESRKCEIIGELEAKGFWKFRVYYSDNSEEEGEGWDVILELGNSVWSAVSIRRKVSGRSLPLLPDDRYSPGMRPQVAKAFTLYQEGQIDAAIKRAGGMPADEQAPPYSPLVGENGSGAGFHFKSGKNYYIACSLHQFGGAVPKSMTSNDFDAPIVIEKQVKRGDDIQVLTYSSKELDSLPFLSFDVKFEPEAGQFVYLYSDLNVVRARIGLLDPESNSCVAITSEGYKAGGMSGSPVVSAENNKVIGVLLGANSADNATEVTFELLLPSKKAKGSK